MRFFISLLLIFLGSAVVVPSGQTADDYLSSDPITSSRCNIFTFDSSGSYDADDENITIQWDFGDGTFSDLPVIDHIYEVTGDYPVTLAISDHSSETCCTSVIAQIVRAIAPPEVSFTGPDKACTDEPVIFGNTSEQVSTDGFLYVYSWDFGDGTRSSEGGSVEKVYVKGGDYQVTLTADNQQGQACGVRSFSKNIYVNQPPIAEAGADVMEQCLSLGENGALPANQSVTVNFDASLSRDENGNSLRHNWDFGDGAQGQGVQVAHTYDQPGNYEVRLIVSDQTDFSCNASVDFIQLRIGVAPRAEAGEAAAVCPGEEVFFDGSGSWVQTKGTLSARWDFGDGEFAEDLKVSHTYRKSGRYPAVLTVKNLTNQACPESQDTKSVLVNTPPEVVLADIKPSCAGEMVEFSANATDSDGDALEYYWTFGDGSIIRGGPTIAHAYQQGGQYRVSVIVDDGQKTACSTGTAEALVRINTSPQAHIFAPEDIHLGKSAEFNASASMDSDGDSLTYQWGFGDDQRGDGVSATHVYQDRGSYQVKLIVDDNAGSSCSQNENSVAVEVRSAPVAVMSIR